jgi:hypothetical protein|tara:strand:- start:200 stop:403 length:204 start_codon:yes stop_codon:yes gene_type:complete
MFWKGNRVKISSLPIISEGINIDLGDLNRKIKVQLDLDTFRQRVNGFLTGFLLFYVVLAVLLLLKSI